MKQTETGKPEPLIYRQISFDLETFERVKDEQRKMERQLGRTVTNAEALCALIARAPR